MLVYKYNPNGKTDKEKFVVIGQEFEIWVGTSKDFLEGNIRGPRDSEARKKAIDNYIASVKEQKEQLDKSVTIAKQELENFKGGNNE